MKKSQSNASRPNPSQFGPAQTDSAPMDSARADSVRASASQTNTAQAHTSANAKSGFDSRRDNQADRANQTKRPSSTDQANQAHQVNRRRELWMYLAVSIVAIEFFIFVAALFFAFITSANGRIQFPWLSWAATAIAIPCILLIAVHMAVGLFTSSATQNEEWQRHLPERVQRAYTIIKRAPAVVLLLGLIVIGVALFTLDGAFQILEHFLALFRPYILHILAGTAIVILILGLGSFWLSYRTRKLYADYEYRRAVLEKTGLIIVGEKDYILSGHHPTLTPIAAESAKALPQGESNRAKSTSAPASGNPDGSTGDTTGDTLGSTGGGAGNGTGNPEDNAPKSTNSNTEDNDITDASYIEVTPEK